MSHLTKRCKNCDQVVRGKYCSHCGQKTNLHRINFQHVYHAFMHGLLHFETGFLFTAKELITRPGATIREFIRGKRVKHGNPLFTLLIVGGLLSYVYSRLAIKTMSSINLEELDHSMHFLTSKFFAATYLGYCLFFSFVDLLFFKYKRYNYMEFLFLNIFIAIEVMLLNLLMSPILYSLKGTGINVYLRLMIYILIISYFILVRYQFFELKKDKKGFRRLIVEMVIFAFVLGGSAIKTFQSFF